MFFYSAVPLIWGLIMDSFYYCCNSARFLTFRSLTIYDKPLWKYHQAYKVYKKQVVFYTTGGGDEEEIMQFLE